MHHGHTEVLFSSGTLHSSVLQDVLPKGKLVSEDLASKG